MWAFVFLAFAASMLITGQMARARNRSIGAWVWIAARIGPLGPVALYALGNS